MPEAALKGRARTSLDSPHPSPAQLQRRQRSNEIIEKLGLPFSASLPVVEDEHTLVPRTTEEIAHRCLAIVVCAVKGETNKLRLVRQLTATYGTRDLFTAKERAFIDNPSPARQDFIDFAWGYEHAHVLLWALGYLPSLKPASQICHVPAEIAVIRERTAVRFVADARPRRLAEVLDAVDLYYRLHWAAIELRLRGKKSDQVNEEVVVERHRALNWLIRHMGQEWDDVRTDT